MKGTILNYKYLFALKNVSCDISLQAVSPEKIPYAMWFNSR